MWRIRAQFSVLLLAVSSSLTAANSLVERFGQSFAGLPDYLEFDCTDASSGHIDAFGQTMRVPRHFTRPDDERKWLEWLIPLGDGIVTTVFSTIRIGSIPVVVQQVNSYPPVSTPTDNGVGVFVAVRERFVGEDSEFHNIVLFSDQEYLITEAPVQMDWQSLLQCFESSASEEDHYRQRK